MPQFNPKYGVAWVTGASSGIGRATALVLAQKGWRVAVTARRADLLDELCQLFPERIFSYPADITQINQVRGVVAQIEADWGPIQLALLNAGAYYPDTTTQVDIEHVQQQFNVNVFGTVQCLQAVLPHMQARRNGHIAFVASVAGYRGLPNAFSYGATKAALIHMAETAKLELAPHNIKVQVINPGFVDTPATAQNEFYMPGLMPVDKAARALVKGLQTHRFEVAFPRGFTAAMRVARCLPYKFYFPLIAKMTKQRSA